MKLDLKLIKSHIGHMGTLTPGRIEIFDTLPSTNTYLKNISTENLETETRDETTIHFCLAEHQSAGYGRFERQWTSPAETNIYLSCRWQKNNLNHLNGLSIVVGLSVIAALKKYGVPDIAIKWPNDVYWQDKKLAGILIELSQNAIIIGIGLNVNMSDSHAETISRPWTSLEKIGGNKQDRNKIAGLLINDLLAYLELFKKNTGENNLAHFMSEWKKVDYLLDKKITLHLNTNTEKSILGIAKGINTEGYLLLEEENGKINTYSAGEVTLSPLPS